MNSRGLKALNIHVIGALPSRCSIAQFIAALITMKGLSRTPSLNALGRVFRESDTSRHTSSSGDYLRIDDSIVTSTRRHLTVWTLEAFALVMPLPIEPAVAARLAA